MTFQCLGVVLERANLTFSPLLTFKDNLKKKNNKYIPEQPLAITEIVNGSQRQGQKGSVLIRTLKYFNAYTLYFCELDYIAF